MKRVLALAVCLVLAGCGGAKPGTTKTLRIATIGPGLQTWMLPLTLAGALGTFKEEGIEATFEMLPSAAKGMAALVGGSVDVAGLVYFQTIPVTAEGQTVQSFFVMTHYGTNALVVAPKATGQVTRVEDLKGQLVGVTAPGSASHIWANSLLGAHGLKPTDVSAVGIGVGMSAVSALEQGRVPAAVLASGDYFLFRKRNPGLRVLFDSSTPEGLKELYGIDRIASGVMLARPEWLEKNAELARGVGRALVRANQWMAAHSPEEVLEKIPENMRTTDRALDLDVVRWALPAINTNGRMPTGGAEAGYRMVAVSSEKVRGAKIDLAATWTDAYLEAGK